VNVRRLAPIGAGVTALVVLAGIASHGRPFSSHAGTGPSATFFDYVATTLALLAVLLLAVFVWLLVTGEAPGRVRPKRTRGNLIGALLFFFAASFVAYFIAHSQFQQRLQAILQRTNPHPTGTRRVGKIPPNARNPHTRWDEVAVVGVLVAGLLVYLLVTRRPRVELRPLVRRRQEVSQVLDESLDDLRSDPDVRRAIIAAYARMERALGRSGIPRLASEAPFEYLERALRELETSAAAARRLTDLFERAKFSQHEPDETMRNDAVDALIAVRDELRA
jgi:hypothetical protein